MKPAALFTSMLLLVTPLCSGQQTAGGQPASKEDVEKLFVIMHVRDMTKQMLDTALKQSLQMAHDQRKKDFPNMPPERAAEADKVMEEMLHNFPVEEIVQVMIPVYQKHFTKGDIDAILEFYSSPAGQKFLRETPAITQETLQASSGLLQQHMQTAMQKVRQHAEQLQKDTQVKPTQR
jgi:uncharacterized protein